MLWTMYLVTALVVSTESFAASPNQLICVCRCCYRGDCLDVDGTALAVDSCQDCSASLACNGTVEAAQKLLAGPGGHAPKLACLALAAAERSNSACIPTANRPDGARQRCSRSTTLNARCVNRGGLFQWWSCMVWLAAVAFVLLIDVKYRAFFRATST